MEKNPEEIARTTLRKNLLRKLSEACAKYGLITDGDHILVGLSGGKDSLALVELLGRRAQIFVPKFQVTAVHVRVRERKYITSTTYLEDFCREWKVPLLVRDTAIGAEEKKDPCFLCSWYRRKVLFDVAQELNCNKIALGHHQDDIEETLLMNLIYQGHFGTIPPLLPMEKMPIALIRPLCLIRENDLQRYADLSGYRKQETVCPFEKESSRAQMKELMKQLEKMNPDIRSSLWKAMQNIKTDYLPKIL